MKRERKIYYPAFKSKAVELSNKGGNISELGIKVTLLYKWRKEYKKFGEGSFSGRGNLKLTPVPEKIHQLEKKLKDTELERDILKKAICIFFQERSMKYRFIKNHEYLFPIEKMCKVLELLLNCNLLATKYHELRLQNI